MKKIYYVTVKNDFYCVAENEQEAEKLYSIAEGDFPSPDVVASEVYLYTSIPDGWLDALTYGEKEDIKLQDWISKNEQDRHEQKRQAELDARQMKLPLGK